MKATVGSLDLHGHESCLMLNLTLRPSGSVLLTLTRRKVFPTHYEPLCIQFMCSASEIHISMSTHTDEGLVKTGLERRR